MPASPERGRHRTSPLSTTTTAQKLALLLATSRPVGNGTENKDAPPSLPSTHSNLSLLAKEDPSSGIEEEGDSYNEQVYITPKNLSTATHKEHVPENVSVENHKVSQHITTTTPSISDIEYHQYMLARDYAASQQQALRSTSRSPSPIPSQPETQHVTLQEPFDMNKLEEWTKLDLLEADHAYQAWLDRKSKSARSANGSTRSPSAASGMWVDHAKAGSRPDSRHQMTPSPMPPMSAEQLGARKQIIDKALADWAYKKRVEALEKAQQESTKKAQEQFENVVEQEKKTAIKMKAEEAYKKWRQQKAEALAKKEAEQAKRAKEEAKKAQKKKELDALAYATWKATLPMRESSVHVFPHRIAWTEPKAPQPAPGLPSGNASQQATVLSPPLLYKDYPFHARTAPEFLRKWGVLVASAGKGLDEELHEIQPQKAVRKKSSLTGSKGQLKKNSITNKPPLNPKSKIKTTV